MIGNQLKSRTISFLKSELILEGDPMEERKEFMITVSAPPENFQIKVNFGRREDRERAHSKSENGEWAKRRKGERTKFRSLALAPILPFVIKTRVSFCGDACGASSSAYACSSCTSCAYDHKACVSPLVLKVKSEKAKVKNLK